MTWWLPPTWKGTNEERVSAYVLDILERGNWVCPVDGMGRLITKPPLYAWLGSVTSLFLGGVAPPALRLPSTLALLWTSWAIFFLGRRWFGFEAALFGALALVCSPIAVRQFALARYDVLFGCMVTLGAAAAFAAWTRGRGWTWFWLAAAGATLAKGPFGVFLAAAGLVACAWEKRTHGLAPLRGSHLPGVGLYFLLGGGWFAAAYFSQGQELIDQMILGQLVSNAVGGEGEAMPGSGLFKPTVAFLTDFMPWSVLGVVALVRVWRHPAADGQERRLERFLTCWFLAGLIVFSLAAHQRARLIFPIIPPAALLAGRELGRLIGRERRRRLWPLVAGVVAVLLVGLGVYYFGTRPRSRTVRETVAMREAAVELGRSELGRSALRHVDSLFSFQFYRGELQRRLSVEEAVRLLEGELRVFLAVRNKDLLREQGGSDLPLHELFRWPSEGEPLVRVVSNRAGPLAGLPGK